MAHRRMFFGLITLAVVGLAASQLDAQSPIDTQQSIITIRVFKSGLFSPFSDNHEVQAPVSEGTVDEAKHEVQFVIKSGQLKVLDPGLSPDKRAEVQTRMLGPDVLDAEKFPEIRFRSTRVEQAGQGGFRVQGDLTLHGEMHPVSVEVEGHDGSYRGHCTLKQRDYGIKPINIAGGTVKVKDELKIEFTIMTARP